MRSKEKNIIVKFKNNQINHYVFPSNYDILNILAELKEIHNQDFSQSKVKQATLIEQINV